VAKRKINKSESKTLSSFLFIFSWFVVGVVAVVLLVGIGYYYGYQEGVIKSDNEHQTVQQKLLQKIEQLQHEAQNSRSVPLLKQKLQSVLKENRSQYIPETAAHEYADAKGKNTPPPEAMKRKIVRSSVRPKLAIIIDDVSFKRDVDAINALKMPLTMSFLPPSERHPNSAELAKNESFYMVHLPLEAMRFSSEEPLTFHVNDSQHDIEQRIKVIKRLFPKVAYVNNHTGSKFTADENAVNKLIYTLRQNNIKFIDSRTTAETKVPKVQQSYGAEYVARDVFLDHKSDISYIKKQIRLAISKAKEHGSAIAIGHPRSETLQALQESTKILEEVELVRIDALI
jgi:hypothetical protein